MPPAIHVLLVEDDPLTAMNTERVLRRSRDVSSVTVAADGRDALELLQGGTLAQEDLVVLTDLRMPRMSGLELTAAIRASPVLRALPIVFLTTSEDVADRDAALAMDVAGYFVKSSRVYLDQMMVWVRGYCGGAATVAG